MSIFIDEYLNYAEFGTFIERVKLIEGNSTQEKVERWLLSIGGTSEQITSILEIFSISV